MSGFGISEFLQLASVGQVGAFALSGAALAVAGTIMLIVGIVELVNKGGTRKGIILTVFGILGMIAGGFLYYRAHLMTADALGGTDPVGLLKGLTGKSIPLPKIPGL